MTIKNIWRSLVDLLSRNCTVIFLISIALFFRIEYALFNQEFNSDKEFQIIAAQSFLEGGGFKVPTAEATDISRIHYKDYYQWPKGYSVYFLGVYFLVRDVFWASFILDALAILLYLFSWRQLLRIFSESGRNRNLVFSIFLMLFAFSNVPFFFLKSSDLVAISLYLFSLSLLFTDSDKRRGNLPFFTALIVLFLTLYERYAYIPVAFLLLTGFLLMYYKTPKKIYIGRFLFAVLVLSIFVILTNHSSSAPAFENEADKTGYNWSTLRKFDFMFPINAIVPSNTIHSVTKILFGKYFMAAYFFLLALFLTLFAWVLQKLIVRFLSEKTASQSLIIILSSLIAGLASVFLLIYLSLTRPVQNNDVLIDWTYVEEQRYYVIVWMAILMSLLFVVIYDTGLLRKIILSIFFISIIIEIPYLFYNKYEVIKGNRNYFLTGEQKIYFPQYLQDRLERDQMLEGYDKLDSIIQAARRINGIRPVYLSPDRSELIAVLKGSVFCEHRILGRNVFSNKRQSIIIKLPEEDKYSDKDLKSFVESNNLKYCYRGRIGRIYVCSIFQNRIAELVGRE